MSGKILYRGGEAEITEKKSRFIATSSPVRTDGEALAFVDSMRRKYHDARHHCYAWVIGESGRETHCSDDGEPSQTAGKPILNVLLNAGVTDVCLVVTRYFGGTLLGTGGLVRAYTQAAKEGLSAGVVLEKIPAERWFVEADYADLGKLQHVALENDIPVSDTRYTDRVTLSLLIPLVKKEEISALISQKTNARARIVKREFLPYGLWNDEIVLFESEALAIPNE